MVNLTQNIIFKLNILFKALFKWDSFHYKVHIGIIVFGNLFHDTVASSANILSEGVD